MIEEILNEQLNKVLLIIRPRRFGKSLNMSMLYSFFSNKSEEKEKSYFNNPSLSINRVKVKYNIKGQPLEVPAMDHLGQYPVLRLSFKGIIINSRKDFLMHLARLSQEAHSIYKDELLETNKHERPIYEKLLAKKAEDIDTIYSFKKLTQFLYKRYNQKKVIILIDEYDSPMFSCDEKNRDTLINEMCNFLNLSLKDNEYLKFVVITGTLNISKLTLYGIQFKFYGFSTQALSSCFGFSEDEIRKNFPIINDKSIINIKEYYGGYQVFDKILYNPWSVINFYEQYKDKNETEWFCDSYWIDNIETSLIITLIKENDDIKNDLRKLTDREKVIKEIIEPAGNKNIYKDTKGLWSFLFFNGFLSGQLKREQGILKCELKIPNREVLDFFKQNL